MAHDGNCVLVECKTYVCIRNTTLHMSNWTPIGEPPAEWVFLSEASAGTRGLIHFKELAKHMTFNIVPLMEDLFNASPEPLNDYPSH
jgi:hypothetical protein